MVVALTYAAKLSPIKSPSLIFMAPIISSGNWAAIWS